MVAKKSGFWVFILGLWASVKGFFGIKPRECTPFTQWPDGSWRHLLDERSTPAHAPPDMNETLRTLALLAQTNESGAVAPTDLMRLDGGDDAYTGETLDFDSVIAFYTPAPRRQPLII